MYVFDENAVDGDAITHALIAQGGSYYGVNIQLFSARMAKKISEVMKERGAETNSQVRDRELVLTIPDPDDEEATRMTLYLVRIGWDGDFGFDSGHWDEGQSMIGDFIKEAVDRFIEES